MHHVKHLRKGFDPKQKGFTQIMSSLNRKQIPVCLPCHRKIHLGEYNGLALKDLKRGSKSKKNTLGTLVESSVKDSPILTPHKPVIQH